MLEGHHLAGLTGRLQVTGGCLTVGEDARWVVSWPEGTTWSDLTQTIHFDGVTARVGEVVSVGGGEITPPAHVDADFWAVAPTNACLALPAWWRGGSLRLGSD